jgi:hypothetical protein
VTKKGREHRPAFTPGELREVNAFYEHRPEWPQLRALAANELFAFAKGLRDDWTHGRRLVSDLHGEEYRSYGTEPSVAGVNAADHLAIVLAIYDAILRPAVEFTGDLLAEPRAVTDPPGG